jgi:hypothetical protein
LALIPVYVVFCNLVFVFGIGSVVVYAFVTISHLLSRVPKRGRSSFRGSGDMR